MPVKVVLFCQFQEHTDMMNWIQQLDIQQRFDLLKDKQVKVAAGLASFEFVDSEVVDLESKIVQLEQSASQLSAESHWAHLESKLSALKHKMAS